MGRRQLPQNRTIRTRQRTPVAQISQSARHNPLPNSITSELHRTMWKIACLNLYRNRTGVIALSSFLMIALSCGRQNVSEENVGAVAYQQLRIIAGLIEQQLLEDREGTNQTVQGLVRSAKWHSGDHFQLPGVTNVESLFNPSLRVWKTSPSNEVLAYFPRLVQLRTGSFYIGILGDGSRTNLAKAPF